MRTSQFNFLSRSNLLNADQKQRGFTLLEVMVALAIFAVAAIALTQAGMSYTYAVSTLSDRSAAHYLLMNEAASLRINRAWPEGTGERLLEQAGQSWQLRYQTFPTPVLAVRRVELSLFAMTDAQQPATTASQRLVIFLNQPRVE
ncbi:MAG: type II secretion system minor pseudopilin GspI [Flavobacteriales bacterium]